VSLDSTILLVISNSPMCPHSQYITPSTTHPFVHTITLPSQHPLCWPLNSPLSKSFIRPFFFTRLHSTNSLIHSLSHSFIPITITN
jgi:hypothetical protein